MCIVTFEEEEGPKFALKNNDRRTCILLGEPLKFTKANSPTDIIWENRNQKHSLKKHVMAIFALFLLLLSSFIVIYEISAYEQEIADTFPAVDCTFIDHMYGNKLEKFAMEGFRRFDEQDDKQTHGAYQCWCEKELARDYAYALGSDYGHPAGTRICAVYDSLLSRQLFWITLLELSIVLFNIILRKFCFALVNKLAYSQETIRLVRTTKMVFWMQFINTAVLLFMVNANMQTSPLTFGLVGGSLRDFNRTWFKIIGNTIIGSMVIGVLMPIIEALIEKILLSIERCFDRGCCPKDRFVT